MRLAFVIALVLPLLASPSFASNKDTVRITGYVVEAFEEGYVVDASMLGRVFVRCRPEDIKVKGEYVSISGSRVGYIIWQDHTVQCFYATE